MKMIHKITTIWVALNILGIFFCHSQTNEIDAEVVKQITATGAAVREALKNGDVETIKLYHHPEVVKALGYNLSLIHI